MFKCEDTAVSISLVQRDYYLSSSIFFRAFGMPLRTLITPERMSTAEITGIVIKAFFEIM